MLKDQAFKINSDHKIAFRCYIEDGKAVNNTDGKSDSEVSAPEFNGHSSKSKKHL